jgi:tetratricopeptide (TPR) repeat protein
MSSDTMTSMVKAERLQLSELMPPETNYRPKRRSGGFNVLTSFTIFFVATIGLLYFSSSIVPIFLFFGVLFTSSLYHRHSQMQAVEDNQSAVLLLNAGDVDEAAEVFERLTESERHTRAHPVYVFNRAVAYMLQGRLKRAFSLFNAVKHSRHFHFGAGRGYLPLMYIEMASCLALMGHLDDARDYLRKARKGLQGNDLARLAFPETVIGLRSGRPGDTIQRLSEIWRTTEDLLRVPTMRALRLLLAYAYHLDGAEPAHVRRLLDAIDDPRPGEFGWVVAEWPELREFVRRNGFSLR